MKTITLSELRDHTEECFAAIEQGEQLEVRRNGKAIAKVTPVQQPSRSRWKRTRPLDLGRGVSLSAAILEERAEDR